MNSAGLILFPAKVAAVGVSVDAEATSVLGHFERPDVSSIKQQILHLEV
jgi:hypothetical protein